MVTVGRDGKIGSSGRGMDGLGNAWRGLHDLLTIELPRLLAALARIGH